MSTKSTLDTLEELKETLDLYNPIKYESTEESKRLREKIPQLYGAIEKKYRDITGNLKIVVEDRENGVKSTLKMGSSLRLTLVVN